MLVKLGLEQELGVAPGIMSLLVWVRLVLDLDI